MAHLIEEAKSGRASCRTCRKPIAKGELRFGEEFDSQFNDGGSSHRWHHLACAASALPDALKPTLDDYGGEVAERATIDQLISAGKKATKPGAFPYADRAPTGRARCMFCEAAIEKGTLRIAVERQVDTGAFVTKGAGYLHPACASEQLERDQVEAEGFILGLKANSRLESAELDQVLAEL